MCRPLAHMSNSAAARDVSVPTILISEDATPVSVALAADRVRRSTMKWLVSLFGKVYLWKPARSVAVSSALIP